MKTLIIYYSYEGNTEFMARSLAEHLKADMLKLEPVNEQKHSGFMKYVWGGKQVFMNRRPELKPLDKNPADYELLIIGTPVWAFTHTPALSTFLQNTTIKGKKIILFCCSQGGNGNVFKNLRAKLEGNEILGQMPFYEPKSHNPGENAHKAKAWVEGLLVFDKREQF